MKKNSLYLLIAAFMLAMAGCSSLNSKAEQKETPKAPPAAEKPAQEKAAAPAAKQKAAAPGKEAAKDVKFTVAAAISDNMVLQREMRVPIWGTAAPARKSPSSLMVRR